MIGSVGRVLGSACNVGTYRPARPPLFSFTPSPLRGEGWGEGAATSIAQHSNTERTA